MKTSNRTNQELIDENILLKNKIQELKQLQTRHKEPMPSERLRIREERYRALLQNLETGIVIHAPDTSIIMSNPRASELLGLSDEQMKGKEAIDPSWKFVDEDNNQLLLEDYPVNEILSSKKPILNQRRGIHRPRTGDIVWVTVNGFPIFKSNGNLSEIVISFVDITESRKARIELLESEKKFKSLYDNAPLSYQSLDENGCFLDVNPIWLKTLGYTKEEVIGKKYADFLHPDWKPHFDKNFPAFKKRGYVNGVQFKIRHKNGHYLDIEFEGCIGYYPDGTFKQTYCVFQNITERKKTEEKIKQQQYQQEKAQELGHIGSWELNIEENKLIWTDENCRIFGVPKGSVVNYETFLEKVHPDDREYVDREWKAAVEGKPYDIEHRIVVDKVTKWIREKAEIGFNSKGIAISAIGFSQDITIRKEAEKEQEKLQSQLVQAQKMESIGRLAGGIAHDFNNMLGVILGNAEMIMEELSPSTTLYKDMKEIKKAAQRSADLTRQLLAFARKQTVIQKVLDLNKTLEGMLKMLERMIGESISLIWKPNVNLSTVKMDPSQIDQLLANLCVNARDSIEDIGTITIETSNVAFNKDYCAIHEGFIPGDFVMISVSDDGCGMTKETQDKIFEPFFTTKDVGEGTGLGLSTIYGIVQQNNGFIKVYSQPEKGTTFNIYFPKFKNNEKQNKKNRQTTPDIQGNKTILLVEDEHAILTMTTKMLEKLGYEVIAINTPDQAIRIAKEYSEPIHMLMTDVVMPEMNGNDLAKNILKLHPHIKCLFMSGYTADVIAIKGVLNQDINFIQKPFSIKELSIKIHNVMDNN